jgi:4-aminobutyrate aminotransferase-like enzyme/Ser/Thr protein kinase RdoA (MazF antagonist)
MTDAGLLEVPRLDRAQIERVLADAYGLTRVTQELLGGEIDLNVKVTTSEGDQLLLKISSDPVSVDQLRWQNVVLAKLAEGVPGVHFPTVVSSTDGREIVVVREGKYGYAARLFSWIQGEGIGELAYHSPSLLRELGTVAGAVAAALETMAAPDERPEHDWDMTRARDIVDQGLASVEDPTWRGDVEEIMSWFDGIAAQLETLPRQVIHQDLNDANVLVTVDAQGAQRIAGIIDVNDALHTVRVAEIAVCAGYAMLRKPDPLGAAIEVISAFDAVVPLTDEELASVFPLAATRLCMNAVTWTKRVRESGTPYGQARMRDTWPAVHRIARIVPEVAEVAIRSACGRPVKQGHVEIELPVTTTDGPLTRGRRQRDVDLSVASDLFDDLEWSDARELRRALDGHLVDVTSVVGVLGHLEASLLRAARRQVGVEEPTTVRLGLGLLLQPGEELRLSFDAVVERSPAPQSPLVLRHALNGRTFWTCWWGVDSESIVESKLAAGTVLGAVSSHQGREDLSGLVQVAGTTWASLVRRRLEPFVRPSEREAWAELTFDPRSLLGLERAVERPRRGGADVLASRERHIGRSQRTYYRRPMNLVRGRGVWFYDEDGLAYLDSLNNVSHVGHAEPRVTAAAQRQMKKLNTNSRFLYEGIADYAERLVATLPSPLEVVFLVCSGSEANDLAIRIVRQVTGRQDVAVIDGAYHGNTGVVTGLSPNRYKGPGGAGAPPTTHEVPTPDRYRGAYGYDDESAGAKFAADASSVFQRLADNGTPPAAFIAESLMGTAGNIVLPPGYLAAAFDSARAAGALCISDEVQVGVGRMGDAFWGFELGGVVPDIVTMGKPLGNGHPVAAVVTTRAIADAFDTGMKYFNTFGGNPVSCAIGQAVLDVVEEDGLQAHALGVGTYFRERLEDLKGRQALIGDVRGQGLYLGVDLVTDRATKAPAAAEAMVVTELMKDRGVVVYPNGILDNVLKIKPPMVFTREHVDLYVETLDEVLSLPELHHPRYPRSLYSNSRVSHQARR